MKIKYDHILDVGASYFLNFQNLSNAKDAERKKKIQINYKKRKKKLII